MQHFLIQYLFLILSAFTTFALPLILRYLWQRAAAMHDTRVHQHVVMLAAAAQQLIPDTSARYEWVAAALAARFRYLNAAQIQQLIEAAVHAIKTTAQPAPMATGPIVTRDIDLTADPNDQSRPQG